MQELREIWFDRAARRHFSSYDNFLSKGSYIVTADTAAALVECNRKFPGHVIQAVREFEDYSRWNGEELHGKSVLYLYDGGLGDTLVHTAAVRALFLLYPTIDLHVIANYENSVLWHANRDIGWSAHQRAPVLTKDEVRSFDYVIAAENVGWKYRGISDDNIYDLLARDLQIEIKDRVPNINLTDTDEAKLRAVHGLDRREWEYPYIVIQTTAGEDCRTPPVTFWFDFMRVLRKQFPNHLMVVFTTEELSKYIKSVISPAIGKGVLTISADKQTIGHRVTSRGALSLIKEASFVVAPDSFAMHGSAAFETPCLALWNTNPDPSDRIPFMNSRCSTYSNVQVLGWDNSPQDIVNYIQANLFHY